MSSIKQTMLKKVFKLTSLIFFTIAVIIIIGDLMPLSSLSTVLTEDLQPHKLCLKLRDPELAQEVMVVLDKIEGWVNKPTTRFGVAIQLFVVLSGFRNPSHFFNILRSMCQDQVFYEKNSSYIVYLLNLLQVPMELVKFVATCYDANVNPNYPWFTENFLHSVCAKLFSLGAFNLKVSEIRTKEQFLPVVCEKFHTGLNKSPESAAQYIEFLTLLRVLIGC